MTNFRKWFKGEYPGGHTSGYYFAHKAWQYRQQEIDQLKAQLNNMEQCYIEKKKQVEAVEHVLGCAMIGPKEVFQYADRIGKALRGDHDIPPNTIVVNK